jgi:predicted ATPase
LRKINLNKGTLRGLSSFSVDFDYPITAIAGKNGAGKSTMLALACCAFHNASTGFKLPNRKQAYYTFADFFVQHSEDIPPEGIEIFYSVAHNNWRVSTQMPEGKGVAAQKRSKKKGGKWTNYGRRIYRSVIFLGIERIVPHSEKSQSKSYSKSFSHSGANGWENEVKDIVGKILGKKYDEFKYVSHSKYRLPVVVANGKRYSGFNMGAGENALFEVFSVLHATNEGSLVVIDEIELGLHSEAQKKFIKYLKNVCKNRKIQIICTTHSKDVFSQLPDDARVFVENINGKTIVSKGISPEFAFAKLSAENPQELCVLVEDKVAKALITASLPSGIRSRINIEVIGSASALSRQLASNYIRQKQENIMVIFDGDQRSKENKNLSHAYTMTESTDHVQDIKAWMKSRVEYLPSETWPEAWIVQKCSENIGVLSSLINVDADELVDIIQQGLEAGKHNEFHEIASLVGLEEQDALNCFCLAIKQCDQGYLQDVANSIVQRLNG